MKRQEWMTDSLVAEARRLEGIGRYELARRTGLSEWQARALIEYVRFYGRADGNCSSMSEDDAIMGLVIQRLSRPMTLEALCDSLGVLPASIRSVIRQARERGYPIDELSDGSFVLNREPASKEMETPLPPPSGAFGDEIVFGIVSDTHIGSKHQQITHLKTAYKIMADMGVTAVYHAGDLLAGVDVYRGQHNEVFLHSYAEQIDYAENSYPLIDGVKTYIIAGNHDIRCFYSGGFDPVVELSRRRPDIVSLGVSAAWARSDGGGVSVYLLHPSGASGMSPEHKLRRLIAHLASRGELPTIAVSGHWHQACRTRALGTVGYMPGCFENITDYELRKMLQPQLGALVLSISLNDEGKLRTITERWIENLVPIIGDW